MRAFFAHSIGVFIRSGSNRRGTELSPLGLQLRDLAAHEGEEPAHLVQPGTSLGITPTDASMPDNRSWSHLSGRATRSSGRSPNSTALTACPREATAWPAGGRRREGLTKISTPVVESRAQDSLHVRVDGSPRQQHVGSSPGQAILNDTGAPRARAHVAPAGADHGPHHVGRLRRRAPRDRRAGLDRAGCVRADAGHAGTDCGRCGSTRRTSPAARDQV
jgi:hypothetical protein